MPITNKKSAHKCEITIGKHTIEQANQIKYLGIIFDQKLCWKPHIRRICTKLSKGCWAKNKH